MVVNNYELQIFVLAEDIHVKLQQSTVWFLTQHVRKCWLAPFKFKFGDATYLILFVFRAAESHLPLQSLSSWPIDNNHEI